jgi:hypothetical protein
MQLVIHQCVVSVASAGLPARPNGLAKMARPGRNSTSVRLMPHEKFLWIMQN